MNARRRRDPDADLRAMRIRHENFTNLHKNAYEEKRLMRAIADAQKIRDLQHQYGALREAHERMPIALQGESARRLRDVSTALISLETQYPFGAPTGPSPLQELRASGRRRLN